MKLEINYSKKNRKKHKHVETKQHATKKPMGQWSNQRKSENTLRQTKIETQLSKIREMQQKQL